MTRSIEDTLVAAFAEDPLYVWLFRDPGTRPAAIRANMAFITDLARQHGVVDTAAGGNAVAVWTEPGEQLVPDPDRFTDLLRRLAPERVDAALSGMAACARHQPAGPARVLHLLAVHPEHRGRGIAASLLEPVLAACDTDGTAAYLESSNVRNLSFYRRCGFSVQAEVTVPDGGPVMRPMLRAPSAARAVLPGPGPRPAVP